MQDPPHDQTARSRTGAGSQGNIFSFRSTEKNVLDFSSYRSRCYDSYGCRECVQRILIFMQSSRRAVIGAGRVLAVAILQYVLAFYSWSFVPGNAAPGSGSNVARVLWFAASFPLFWFFPRALMSFDSFLICDALIWGLVLGWLVPLLRRRTRSAA